MSREIPTAKVACPSCGAALAIPEHSPETSIRCPGCQKVFRLNRRSRTIVQEPAVEAVSAPSDSPTSDKPAAINHTGTEMSGAASVSSVSPPEEIHSPKQSAAHRLGELMRPLLNRVRSSSLVSKARRQHPVIKVGVAIVAGGILTILLIFVSLSPPIAIEYANTRSRGLWEISQVRRHGEEIRCLIKIKGSYNFAGEMTPFVLVRCYDKKGKELWTDTIELPQVAYQGQVVEGSVCLFDRDKVNKTVRIKIGA